MKRESPLRACLSHRPVAENIPAVWLQAATDDDDDGHLVMRSLACCSSWRSLMLPHPTSRSSLVTRKFHVSYTHTTRRTSEARKKHVRCGPKPDTVWDYKLYVAYGKLIPRLVRSSIVTGQLPQHFWYRPAVTGKESFELNFHFGKLHYTKWC